MKSFGSIYRLNGHLINVRRLLKNIDCTSMRMGSNCVEFIRWKLSFIFLFFHSFICLQEDKLNKTQSCWWLFRKCFDDISQQQQPQSQQQLFNSLRKSFEGADMFFEWMKWWGLAEYFLFFSFVFLLQKTFANSVSIKQNIYCIHSLFTFFRLVWLFYSEYFYFTLFLFFSNMEISGEFRRIKAWAWTDAAKGIQFNFTYG